MAITDRLNKANQIITRQAVLINLFDEWVQKIKLEEMEEAAKIVKKSNILRTEITILKKDYAKLNKKSGLILLN